MSNACTLVLVELGLVQPRIGPLGTLRGRNTHQINEDQLATCEDQLLFLIPAGLLLLSSAGGEVVALLLTSLI